MSDFTPDLAGAAADLAQMHMATVKKFTPVPRGQQFYRKLVRNLALVPQLEAFLMTLPGYVDPDLVGRVEVAS